MSLQARPIVAEPDERYWRRRANRRVRQERFGRKLRRWSACAVALVITGSALFQAGSHAVERVKEGGGFSVERIEVVGTNRGGPESIRGRLAPYAGRNILDVNLFDVARAAENDPWVLSASAKRVLPGTLHVTVTERRPAALALIDGVRYVVDDLGYVVCPHTLGGFERLPLAVGLDDLDDRALERALARAVVIVERLREEADVWVRGVARLDFSRRDRVAVATVDPGPAILLDPDRVERNLVRYLELRGEIVRRTGPLESVDLRWQDRIAVVPASRQRRLKEDG